MLQFKKKIADACSLALPANSHTGGGGGRQLIAAEVPPWMPLWYIKHDKVHIMVAQCA